MILQKLMLRLPEYQVLPRNKCFGFGDRTAVVLLEISSNDSFILLLVSVDSRLFGGCFPVSFSESFKTLYMLYVVEGVPKL